VWSTSCRHLLVAGLLATVAGISSPLLAHSGEGGPHFPVFIAYAGPYSSSPASAFGHLFLVLPNDGGESVALWDIVSFAADTDGAGPFRFLLRGVAGGFFGRYERLTFHEKVREYEQLDDRDLWLTEVLLTAEQRERLDREIEATAGKSYPYTFFVRNCAYYLQILLANVLDGVDQPYGPTSPTGVFEAVYRSGATGRSFFRPAATRRLEDTARTISQSVASRVRREEWRELAADTAWLANLSAADRWFVQQFFGLNAQKSREALSDRSAHGVALLRALNAGNRIDLGRASVPSAVGTEIPHPDFHGYPRASVSYVYDPTGSRLSLRVRPALHDEADPWTAHRPVNTLDFLSVEASIGTDRDQPALRFESIVLFSQRSLNPSTPITRRQSWMLEAVTVRGGVFDEGLHTSVRSGAGKTFSLGSWGYAYGLVTTGAVTNGAETAFAVGSEAGILILPAPNWRLGARWLREHDAFTWSRHHQRLSGWLRYDLHRDLGLRVSVTVDPEGTRQSLGFDWYPPLICSCR
jgi:hypothetical protein